jgi:hypothetical protein
MELTKKYRLIWDIQTNILIADPYIEYINSFTWVGNNRGYYESNSLEEIQNYIDENNLKYPTNNN